MQLCECECVWRFSWVLEWNFVCMKMLQKFIKKKLVSETVNFNLAIRCICVTAAQFLGRLSIRKLFNLKAYVLLAYSPAHRNSYTFLQMNIWRNCNSHSFHQMNFFFAITRILARTDAIPFCVIYIFHMHKIHFYSNYLNWSRKAKHISYRIHITSTRRWISIWLKMIIKINKKPPSICCSFACKWTSF